MFRAGAVTVLRRRGAVTDRDLPAASVTRRDGMNIEIAPMMRLLSFAAPEKKNALTNLPDV